MRVLSAAVRALPLTFVVYVVEAVGALFITAPLGLELLADDRASFRDAIGRAVWLDRVSELLPALRVSGRSALLVGAGMLLLSPWLRMAWLQALAHPSAVRRSLEHGARLYVTAAWVSVLSLLLLAGSLLPVAGALWLCETVLADSPNARLHDLVLAAFVLPCLLCAWTVHVAHDLACARALAQGAWPALRASLRAALRPSVQLRALAFALIALALHAVQLPSLRRGANLGAVGTVALLQAACFSALFVRSLWLAWTLTCAERRVASRDLG